MFDCLIGVKICGGSMMFNRLCFMLLYRSNLPLDLHGAFIAMTMAKPQANRHTVDCWRYKFQPVIVANSVWGCRKGVFFVLEVTGQDRGRTSVYTLANTCT